MAALPPTPKDPLVWAAEIAGTFIGNVLAAILKKAGPELNAFLVGVIRDALSSKVEVSKPNDALQSLANGMLGPDKGRLYSTGHSDGATRVDSGSQGSSTR